MYEPNYKTNEVLSNSVVSQKLIYIEACICFSEWNEEKIGYFVTCFFFFFKLKKGVKRFCIKLKIFKIKQKQEKKILIQ